VEVDGFHFRRKRRAPPTPVTAAAAAAVAADGTADAPLGYRSPAAGAHGTLQLDACAGGGAKASPLKAAAPAAVQDADAGMADDQQHEGEQQPAGAPAAPGDTAEEVPALPTAAGEAYDSEAADLMDAADDPDVAAATAAAATAAAAAEAAATTAAAAAQEVAALAAAEAAAASAAAAAAGEEATAGAVAAGEPVSFSMLPSELCQLVRTFLSGELQRLPSLTAEAAAQAADAAGAQLAAQLQRQCPPGGEDAAATGADQLAAAAKPRLTVLPYQVVQLKAKLQDKHAK
jgi:SWI/SNF-related matrix-associated actin-dependent regulator 1 of chromatin subfamily A